jgi:hypothetical protein
MRERREQVERGRGLADAPLLIENGDNCHNTRDLPYAMVAVYAAAKAGQRFPACGQARAKAFA